MRKTLILCSIPLLALAACHASVDVGDDDNASDGNVHVAANGGKDRVSVDVPGFSASVSMPNLNLGSHLDLDGIKVAPNTKVGAIDVTAHDNGGDTDNGKVSIGFTDTDAPSAVIEHYAKATVDAGYGDVVRTATSLSARKNEKTFTVNVASQGAGSKGTIMMTGKD